MSLLGIGTTLAGMAYGEYSNDRQNRQDRTNAMMQMQNQKTLNQQGHNLQMDMWNKTNYGAQVKHMKEAGLNPALMYGGAGQGGTTGSQGGGSASKAQAPKAPVMDMSNILAGKQAELLTAQKEKTQAETKAIGGYQRDESVARVGRLNAEELNTIQKTTNLKTDNEVRKVEKELLELKASKKVTGSTVVDLMTQVGLDPVNDEKDRDAVKMILGAYFGSKVVKDIMQGIGGLKGKSIKNVGDRIYKNTNEIKY